MCEEYFIDSIFTVKNKKKNIARHNFDKNRENLHEWGKRLWYFSDYSVHSVHIISRFCTINSGLFIFFSMHHSKQILRNYIHFLESNEPLYKKNYHALNTDSLKKNNVRFGTRSAFSVIPTCYGKGRATFRRLS